MGFAQIMLIVVAALSFIAAAATVIDIRRTTARMPHMVLTTARVRKLTSRKANTRTGGVVAYTDVDVVFTANGKEYTCSTLRLFGGNKHQPVRDPLPEMPAGKEVGVYYDPAKPKRSALMIDKPSYFVAAGAAVFGTFCAVMAATQFN